MAWDGTIAQLLNMQKRSNIRIPSNVAPLIGDFKDGPNCWNATMAWHVPNCRLKYVDRSMAEEWLQGTTMPIHAADVRCGDIMVLRAEGYLVHTAIWVEEDTYFHKIGVAGPWVVQSLRQLNTVYEGDYDLIEWRRYVGVEEKAA